MRALQCSYDRNHHSVNILQHRIIPESQNTKSVLSQIARPFFIGVRILGMLPAVQFNDYFVLDAAEVRNKGPNRMLPPKLRPAKLPIVQS